MVEVGTMVRFVDESMRSGAIGQVLAVDAYESQPAMIFRVLLLTDTAYNEAGTIFPYVDAYEIEAYNESR